MLETALVKAGGLYEKAADMWAAHVTVDGNLYTGQNVSALVLLVLFHVKTRADSDFPRSSF
jgi:putative intracellular protease/amidase